MLLDTVFKKKKKKKTNRHSVGNMMVGNKIDKITPSALTFLEHYFAGSTFSLSRLFFFSIHLWCENEPTTMSGLPYGSRAC